MEKCYIDPPALELGMQYCDDIVNCFRRDEEEMASEFLDYLEACAKREFKYTKRANLFIPFNEVKMYLEAFVEELFDEYIGKVHDDFVGNIYYTLDAEGLRQATEEAWQYINPYFVEMWNDYFDSLPSGAKVGMEKGFV